MSSKKKKSKNKKIFDELDKKLTEEYGEIFGNEKITRVNIADADLEYSKLFGANKNLYRTICSMIDGLKPGGRRLLYAWWDLEKRPMNTKPETLKKLNSIKCSKISSSVSNIHPHGTSGISERLAKYGQYWNNNVNIIVPQGSYGNMRGDAPAAERYREAKVSEYMIDCFFEDFDKFCVPMKLAYDGKSEEPEFLPAKYPHVLFNPQFSGIGYGLASNIPPFNVTEVLDATIQLIINPKSKILLIPDSPTGCDIIDEGLFNDINKTGQSKVTFRATAEIDFVENVIIITSLPLLSTSEKVISKIIDFRKKGEFDEIVEIQDSTKEGNVLIKIKLKSDAKPEKVLQSLFKKNTDLKATFPVGITVIDDYVDYEYGIKELILQWIDYRIDIVRSMFLNKYQIVMNEQHMNDVLLMVFNKDNINTTINIAKTSKSRKETIDRLMKTFKISSLQAATIADMHVYNFNSDSFNTYKEKKIKLEEELKYINEVLQDDRKIEEFVINQLEEGKKKWGSPRKSRIVKENDKDNDNIPNTDHLVGISETGYIKKLSIEDVSSIGHVGKTNSNIVVLSINNRENILVVDSLGNVCKISVSAIPDMNYEDIGIELNKFFSVKGNIKAVMELPTMEILKVTDDTLGIIFVTKNGLAKKVPLNEFKKITDFKSGIVLNKGDEVASAIFSVDNSMKSIIISTNIGNGIHLPINEIRTLSAQAKGVSMVTLKENEEVVSTSIVNPKKKLLFYITSSGRVKITEMKYFPPAMERKSETLNLISLQGNETLIGVSSVEKGDIVEVYKKKGEPETIEIKKLDVGSRASKGNKLIKIGKGDSVVAYKVFKK